MVEPILRQDKEEPSGRWARWRFRRKTRSDAAILDKEVRWLFKKKKRKLSAEVIEELKDVQSELNRNRQNNNIKHLASNVAKLDCLLDKYAAHLRKSAMREIFESIAIAILIALFLRAFFFEAFKIPSGSMIPTLKVGDHLFVNKIAYGIRIPFTRYKPIKTMPDRGDVIVFIYPGDPSKDYIKRVIAIAGDSVELKENIVYVNGKALPRKRLNVPCSYRDGEGGRIQVERRDCVAFEEKHGDYRYRIIQDVNSMRQDYPLTKVKEGTVFVMGDNRDNSRDSRYFVDKENHPIAHGVPIENIKGKALFIWFSKGNPDGLRWGRIFNFIHSYNNDKKNTPIVDGLYKDEIDALATEKE